jgi:hypothetical protein
MAPATLTLRFLPSRRGPVSPTPPPTAPGCRFGPQSHHFRRETTWVKEILQQQSVQNPHGHPEPVKVFAGERRKSSYPSCRLSAALRGNF